MEEPKIVDVSCAPITNIERPNIMVIDIGMGLCWRLYVESDFLDYVGIGDIVKIQAEITPRAERLVCSE